MSEPRERPKGYIREALVIFAAVLGCYLFLSLSSFTPAEQESNLGGNVGWHIAYGSLLLFGKSAYLIITSLIYALWLYISVLQSEEEKHPPLISSIIGLVLLIISTCGLEALRIYGENDFLPDQRSGGHIGFGVAKTLFDLFGFHGATLILLGAWFSSLSLFAMFSWLKIVDLFGRLLGSGWAVVRKTLNSLAASRAANKPPIAKTRPAPPAKKALAKKAVVEPTLGTAITKPAAKQPVKETIPAAKPAAAAEDRGSKYVSPSTELLATASQKIKSMSDTELQQLAETIEAKLAEFGVQATVEEILPGPVVTRYEIQPATGVKGSQVVNLVRDLSRALSVSSIRVLETIPNKTTMGLEVPNAERQVVNLHDLINSAEYQTSNSRLALALGLDIAGNVFIANLDEMPHLLVAGTTGSGKSVQINSMILSILFRATPDEVRMILIDPKVVELAPFDGLPHLLTSVISDMEQVPAVLSWCVAEMERRYQLMAKLGVRNLKGLNEMVGSGLQDPEGEDMIMPLPLIVVVVDELADLMAVSGKKVEQLISRLAQKARAAGIHLILATQRPSVDVITGLIKANVPSRIAFQVSSRIDSRTILDQSGAETLLGKGDMLYLPGGVPQPIRIHGAFVSDEEVRSVTDNIRAAGIETEKIDFTPAPGTGNLSAQGGGSDTDDPMLQQAIDLVNSSQRVSISLVQRHLRIGYNRAARLVEEMERTGIVSPMDSSGNRKLLTAADG